MDINDISPRQETAHDVLACSQVPDRKGGNTAKVPVVIIPTKTADYIMGRAHIAAQFICQYKISSGYGGRIDL